MIWAVYILSLVTLATTALAAGYFMRYQAELDRRVWLEKQKGLHLTEAVVELPPPEPEEMSGAELAEMLIPEAEIERLSAYYQKLAIEKGEEISPEQAREEARSTLYGQYESRML